MTSFFDRLIPLPEVRTFLLKIKHVVVALALGGRSDFSNNTSSGYLSIPVMGSCSGGTYWKWFVVLALIKFIRDIIFLNMR